MTAWLSRHLSEDISLQSIAGEFHLNSSYISQLFKNELGMRYHDYLTKLRMDKAKTLLATTGKSISEIAGEVGFRDYRVFTKVFKMWRENRPLCFGTDFGEAEMRGSRIKDLRRENSFRGMLPAFLIGIKN